MNIKSYFDKVNELSFSTWSALEEILKLRDIKKGALICEENNFYNNEILVLDGLVRGYYYSFENNEVNVSFFKESTFVTPWFYRNLSGKSTINLQALENSVIVEFDAPKFSVMMTENNDLARFGRNVVERELKGKVNREISILCKSGVDKYRDFQKNYPGLENRMAHYHVASYLGITPISLSRIRAQK